MTVAERGGEIAGALVLRDADEGFLLDNIAVTPAHQGQGSAPPARLAEQKARAAGYDSIYLYTQQTTTENQELYARVGYAEYARRREVGLHRVYIRKQLAPRLTADAPRAPPPPGAHASRSDTRGRLRGSGSANSTVER